MSVVADFDVFVSYAHADRERGSGLRDALVSRGLRVWLDDGEIETFESITAAIESGLARCRCCWRTTRWRIRSGGRVSGS